jgi:CRISPR/Cas system CMR subunit Cmr6 (Cas7 group RAMP superfamily)
MKNMIDNHIQISYRRSGVNMSIAQKLWYQETIFGSEPSKGSFEFCDAFKMPKRSTKVAIRLPLF